MPFVIDCGCVRRQTTIAGSSVDVFGVLSEEGRGKRRAPAYFRESCIPAHRQRERGADVARALLSADHNGHLRSSHERISTGNRRVGLRSTGNSRAIGAGELSVSRAGNKRGMLSDARVLARAERITLWDFYQIVCSRHSTRRCNRSAFVRDGSRRCGSCKNRRLDGSRRLSWLRYMQSAKRRETYRRWLDRPECVGAYYTNRQLQNLHARRRRHILRVMENAL